jgi:nucleoside-diphosphate-sugar epimerase
MKTAIVTGANGFIGSHIVYRLLARGCRVYALGRHKGTSPWHERVMTALGEVGHDADACGEISCCEVDLSAAPISPDFLSQRDDPVAETTLFHVAGDTRFMPPDPSLQRQMNVQASVHVVNGLMGRIARMVQVSTAYVAGNRTGLIRESELDCGQEFRNSYERSKFEAETVLTALCREYNIPLVIVRPSIITNDRQTGRASTFTHLNALVEVVSRIQEHYGIADGQVVSQRIRLMADPEARPNLAPVDSILPPLLTIADSPTAPGRTFHLCHPNPLSNGELVNLMSEVFDIKGKVALEFVDSISKPMSRTEETIVRSLKPYVPYLNSRCAFDVSEARAVVPDYDSYFTPIDLMYLRKVVHFQRQRRK